MVLGTIPSAAVTYCAPSAFGYGQSATGGGSAIPELVSSVSQLQSALNKGKNKVIIITADLTFTSMLSVQDGENVTLLGMPGVTLTSLPYRFSHYREQSDVCAEACKSSRNG